MHPAVTKYISERNSKAAKARWKKTSPEQIAKHIEKMNKARKERAPKPQK